MVFTAIRLIRLWRVPHFEKMLYDQALLADAYADAFLATGKIEFRQTAVDTLEYVLRNLASPEGGFYTAEDADSEGEEGRFYHWTMPEIEAILGSKQSALAFRIFGIRAGGNLAEPGGAEGGLNVLFMEKPLAETAAEIGISPDRLAVEDATIRGKLFRAREKRARPFKDTKVLADWNGLAIGALARAFRITDDPRFLGAAEKRPASSSKRCAIPMADCSTASWKGKPGSRLFSTITPFSSGA